MANVLPLGRKAEVIRALVDGCSVRATARITGTNKRTIIRLLRETGERCADILDTIITAVEARNVQVDEVWSFIRKKERNVQPADVGHVGDCYTYIAMDADSRLVLSHLVGRRCVADTVAFMQDLAARLTGRPQITTDGWKAYPDAVEIAFGHDVDYAVLNKEYRSHAADTPAGLKPSRVIWQTKKGMTGFPDPERICTSHVERLNLSVRQATARFARKTLAFSKSAESHAAATALFVAHYNLARIHGSLDGLTPGLAAGVTDRVWEVEDLLTWEGAISSAA